MDNFKESLRVLKEIHKVTKNKELAEKLNLTVYAIDGWVKRKKIPSKYMLEIDAHTKTYNAGYENYINEIADTLKFLDPVCTYHIYHTVKDMEEQQKMYGENAFKRKEFESYPHS
jgi:transcriptional regulator with XRE-family HTH domain